MPWKGIGVAIAVIVAFLIVLGRASGVVVDWAWFSTIGYVGVFWTIFVSPEKRNIAMVFQSYALWPHMTVAQNIGYGLRLRSVGRTEIARRVAELLAMLRLDGLGERKVTALSGGQRQRVA